MSVTDERSEGEPRRPRVVCGDCEFRWFSARMAEGLRALGSCPRCGGELRFSEAGDPVPDEAPAERFAAPHLALGIPRPRPR